MSAFAIETNGLTKRFGDVLAVDAIDLRVGVGEIYGFLGLNGAGKTTTIRALLGMIRPSLGNVKVLGQALGRQGNGGPPRRESIGVSRIIRSGKSGHSTAPARDPKPKSCG
jgi:ABC-type multidrug transport system ATPase subunit